MCHPEYPKLAEIPQTCQFIGRNICDNPIKMFRIPKYSSRHSLVNLSSDELHTSIIQITNSLDPRKKGCLPISPDELYLPSNWRICNFPPVFLEHSYGIRHYWRYKMYYLIIDLLVSFSIPNVYNIRRAFFLSAKYNTIEAAQKLISKIPSIPFFSYIM